jgi:hypothetical protein
MAHNNFKDVYETTLVNAEGTVSESDTTKLEGFQVQMDIAEQSEQDGAVEITLRHREDSTGKRQIDLFRFRRLD